MHYLKSVVKNVYQKVIEDEYLQTLTEHEVYLIINNTSRKRLASHGRDPRKMSADELQTEMMKKVEEIGGVTPQRLFRVFGPEPGVQVVAAKKREIGENLEEISGLMQDNFYRYERKMNQAIAQIDNMKSLYIARKYSMELRSKLKTLEQASIKSKKIAHLNIKAKNLKTLLKILSQIPKIKKMSLTQLKSINMQTIKNKSTLKNLQCLKGLPTFVERAVSAQLSSVLQKLKQCLVIKFNQTQYENALKDFIIAQHQTIKYQILFIKILQNKILHTDTEYQSDLFQICESFLKLMINLHEVYRWHRENEKEERWKNLAEGFYGISIEIDLGRVNRKVVRIMDQSLKDVLLPKFYQSQGVSQYLECLYMVCRMSQIVYTFSGLYLDTVVKEITEFVYKRLQKTKQKALSQLEQTLKYEQKNHWNRLPVVDSYSHEPIDKTMYQIYKHRTSAGYGRVMETLAASEDMLRGIRVEVVGLELIGGGDYVWVDLWGSVWEVQMDPLVCREINGAKVTDVVAEPVKKFQLFSNPQPSTPTPQQPQPSPNPYEQTWQILQTQFPKAQKYEKQKSLTRLKPPSTHKTIICQYSLTILKYIEMVLKYSFYYPIQPVLSYGMGTICVMLQQYVYQIFNGFISGNLKLIFFQRSENLGNLEQRYHKKRLHYQYPNISKFILNFKSANKLTLRESPEQTMTSSSSIGSSGHIKHSHSMGAPTGMAEGTAKENIVVRSRVVALESLQYLFLYFEHVCRLAGFVEGNGEENVRGQVGEAKKQEQSGDNELTESSNPPKPPQTLSTLHPSLHSKLSHKILLYKSLYNELSQLIYTDCIPKMCVLKNTYSLIQSIKWNDDQATINEYMEVFGKSCREFYFKMNSNNRGEVPLQICERLYGIFWKTQLTAIMKAFMNCYRPGKNAGNFISNPKNKLENFIDGLYENVSSVVKDKTYLRVPYEKIKAVFPILMEKSWEVALEMLKLSLQKYQFVFAVSMGLFLTSESCCYLGNDEIEDRKRKVEAWIQESLIDNVRDFDASPIKK